METPTPIRWATSNNANSKRQAKRNVALFIAPHPWNKKAHKLQKKLENRASKTHESLTILHHLMKLHFLSYIVRELNDNLLTLSLGGYFRRLKQILIIFPSIT
jgi:hypothetical protein